MTEHPPDWPNRELFGSPHREWDTPLVAGHERLTALHDGIRQPFVWENDHLCSFWLDGQRWTPRRSIARLRRRTSCEPVERTAGRRTPEDPWSRRSEIGCGRCG